MKPSHLFYPVLLFAVGAWAMLHDGWFWFGVIMWILGAVATAWIVIGGMWAERAKYYDSVSDVLHEVKDVDLEKMAALGLSSQEIKESVKIDLHEGTRSRHFDLPVSAVKLQPLASGLLNGQPFSERRWANLLSASEFRSLRQVMRQRGLIEPVSDKDARQGFVLTAAGRELMANLIPSPPPPREMA